MAVVMPGIQRFFFLLISVGAIICLLSVYSVSVYVNSIETSDLNTEHINHNASVISKETTKPPLTTIFTKYLDPLCLQNGSYPSDCALLLESMINISISLQLDHNEIHILSQRIQYLHTLNHEPMQQPILFIHIPKTGGTGLGKWLQTHSGKRTVHLWIPDNMHPNMFDHYHYPNASKKNKKRARNTKGALPFPQVLYGHVAYGFDVLFLSEEQIKTLNNTPSDIIWKPRVNFTYITVLRHPVTRVPSHYFYQKAGISDENRPWTLQRDLYNWVSWFEESSECLVQFISGCHHRAWYNKRYVDILEPNLNPWPRRKQSESPDIFNGTNITFEQYKIARKHQLMMGHILLTEYLSESLEQLKVFWGKNTNQATPKANVGRKKKKVEQRIIDKIVKYNTYDIALWELGYVMFLQQRIVIKYGYKNATHLKAHQRIAKTIKRKRGRGRRTNTNI